MSFNDLIQDILSDSNEPHFAELTEAEQRQLTSAYIQDNPDIVADVLAEIPCNTIAKHLAKLALGGTCDALQLAYELGNAVYLNDEIESLIDGEFDWQIRLNQKFLRFEENAHG